MRKYINNKSKLAIAIAVVTTLFVSHANAGELANISIMDRNSGMPLPIYKHSGENWIAGIPGSAYSISVKNNINQRIMAVISIDGINVISGKTASWNQTGYVFNPYQTSQITGWRKNNNEVAAFEFSSPGDSYAGKTNRENQIGVIGVAIFNEKQIQPIYSDSAISSENSGSYRKDKMEKSIAGAPTARMNSMPSPSAAPSPALGTGHGSREYSHTENTEFQRVKNTPNEIISIRYDSRENLIARGIIREHRNYTRPGPSPFPNSDNQFVPDPPSYRRHY